MKYPQHKLWEYPDVRCILYSVAAYVLVSIDARFILISMCTVIASVLIGLFGAVEKMWRLTLCCLPFYFMMALPLYQSQFAFVFCALLWATHFIISLIVYFNPMESSRTDEPTWGEIMESMDCWR